MNISTAEEFINNYHRQEGHTFEQTVPEAMIEFAKLHVEAALKQASEQASAFISFDDKPLVSKLSILNSYLLTNIK
jgi:hypothetical protein